MKNRSLTVLLLILIVFLSGCVRPKPGSQTPRQFKGEVVTIENVEIFPVEAFPGSTVSLDLDVMNNVNSPIQNFRFSITEPSFLKLKKLSCGQQTTSQSECTLTLEPFGYEHIHAEFEVLPIVSNSVEQIINFKTSYDYNGTSVISFQIVDWEKVKEKRNILPYKQYSGPSDIKIVFEPGFMAKKVVDKRTVTIRDYMIAGTTFTLQLSADFTKPCRNCIAYLTNLILKTQSVVPVNEGYPDFEVVGDTLRCKEIPIKVPTDYKLTTSFTNVEMEEPIVNGMIVAKYDYTITRLLTKKIKIVRR